jgi:NAD(P)-dependent dehydrogenase (short-subunit alcohol dehydrogenase family)
MGGRLTDRVAIVTGGASGIGAAIGRRFVAEGAVVALADIEKHGHSGADTIPALGRCVRTICDVGKEDQVQACVDTVLGQFGHLDIVVNNAGIMTFKPLAECTAEDWIRVLRVDLLGAAFFTAQALKHMKSGAIVNIASIHALATSPDVAPYAAAKAALVSLTHSTAIEGASAGIRANVILPGAIETPMLRENPNIKSGAEKISEHDIGSPEDIAAAAVFLASDEAKFITGTSLNVDGGRLIRL